MTHQYPAIFLDIDTQFDFMDPQGALYVPQAEQIVPNLRRLFAAAFHHHVPVVSTADCHTPDDPEFADFPPHCVRGTPGQQRLPDTLMASRVVLDPQEQAHSMADLLRDYPQVIFHKQTIDIWTPLSARRLLREVDAGAWYVFGVATDYCVKSAALGLANAGKPTYVVTDAIKAISPEGQKQAMDEMKAAGVRFVTTDQTIEALRTGNDLA
jgi:nicotinamidase/pyrazinamidase